MILAVDVHYYNKHAVVAGVGFECWNDQDPKYHYVSAIDQTEDYMPGEFYRRELPCILKVPYYLVESHKVWGATAIILKLLNEHELSPTYILIDGYVYLDGYSRPGLGKYLYEALSGKVKVIGVAKNPFKGITGEYELYRGSSKKPLYVTCIGEELPDAKAQIAAMYGAHRIPVLLKAVDQLCRDNS